MTINLPGKEDVAEIAAAVEKQNDILKKYFSAVQTGLDFATTWAEFKNLCRLGAIRRYYSAGDQLKCKKGTDTLTWDIVHIGDNEDGSNYVILQLHYCLKETMEFDPREAIFRAPSELPAGTYHFTTSLAGITDTSWTSSEKSGWSKNWQFTTTSAVPKGGQICFAKGMDWNTDLSTIGISTYSDPTSTTAIETVTLSEGTEGTDLATLGTINHAQKICNGYNRWSLSTLRQWLNSDAAAGKWFSAQHDFQRSPLYAAFAGFMNDLDDDFKAVISKSKIITDINKISDSGGHDTTQDYFFLPCIKNLNGGDNFYDSPTSAVQDIEDDVVWDYYLKLRQDGKTGKNTEADANRIKGPANGGTYSWWERSPFCAHAHSVRYVRGDGICWWTSLACNWCGVAPACRIN